MTENRTLVLIPSRMGATRLPGKPLLDIAGLPMIVHVLRRAEAAQIGRVAVATDTTEIDAAVTAPGGRIDTNVNLHGDLPTIPPDDIRASLMLLSDPKVDIGTLCAEIRKEE